MNTYVKFMPNVFIAKCDQRHEKGDIIQVTTRHGKENESIVFNLLAEKDGQYYYSIVRADGMNAQKFAEKRAEKLQQYAMNAENKSDQYYQASNKDRDFLSLGEPIKIGHHSEGRHRRIIEQANKNMGKCIEASKKADEYESRAKYWKEKSSTINLSMPESLEFYEFELEQAKARHEGLKNGTIARDHSYSITYAKNKVNELEQKLKIARKLWGDPVN